MTVLYKIFFLSMVVFSSILSAGAQSNTMYYMQGPPQSIHLNPATQPISNFYFGIPILNSLYLNTHNSGISFDDLIQKDPVSGDYNHILHPDANLDLFFSGLGESSGTSFDVSLPALSFGFRVQDLYFSFDMTVKAGAGVSSSNDLLDFSLRGNENNEEFDFSNIGFHMNSYVEYAVGVSKSFNDVLIVGARPKLLTGLTHISSSENDIRLNTSVEEWVLNSQIDMQMAIPGALYPEDENGDFDLDEDFEFEDISTFKDVKKLAFANKGFGLDLGAHYKPFDRLKLSASIIDIGVIKWNEYAQTVSLATKTDGYSFSGVEFNSSDTIDFFSSMFDSLKGGYDVTGSKSTFTTTLGPKVFVGGLYSIFPNVDVGALARIDIPEEDEKLDANVMLQGLWHPSSVFSLALNYSPFGGRGTTFGMGTFYRVGWISWYFVYDYRALKYDIYSHSDLEDLPIPVGIPLANKRSRYNIRFGANIVIGSNRRKKLSKDKPMYYSEDY